VQPEASWELHAGGHPADGRMIRHVLALRHYRHSARADRLVCLGQPRPAGPAEYNRALTIGLVASLVLVATELVFPGTAVFREASRIVREIHFSAPLLNGMLGFLLFADDRVTACGKSCPHVSLPTAVVERFR
jgi:hypothetical protein